MESYDLSNLGTGPLFPVTTSNDEKAVPYELPHYAFDTYPSHPPPAPLESLTGYLTRIAALNGMTRPIEVRSTLLSHDKDRYQQPPTDFPLISWSVMSTALAVTPQRLLATTLYFVGHKLGRAHSTKSLISFLRESLSTSLRYCPACLKERGIRLLLWRFIALGGCSEHGIHLLNHCGHCGRDIPLFTPPYSVRHCPFCRGDLASCRANELRDDEWSATRTIEHDLTRLLLPQTWEYADSFRPEFVGLVLQRLRNELGWSLQDVAKRLGLQEAGVMRMEWASPVSDKPFHVLYLYATKILCRSLYDVVREACQWTNAVDEAQAVIQHLRLQGEPVTRWKVCRLLGINPVRLKWYPQARATIKAAVDYPKFEQDESAIRRAFSYLSERDVPVTLSYLSFVSIVPIKRLVDYPRIAAERQEMAEQKATRLLKEDEELLGRLRAAVAEWRSRGQPLSEPLLQQVCQKSWLDLLPFRQVRRQIGQWIPHPDVQTDWGRTRHREAELVAQIHEAIRDMKADGSPLTHEGVRLRAQLPPAAVWRWPAVYDVFCEISGDAQQTWNGQLAQQDELLVAKVRHIIQC